MQTQYNTWIMCCIYKIVVNVLKINTTSNIKRTFSYCGEDIAVSLFLQQSKHFNKQQIIRLKKLKSQSNKCSFWKHGDDRLHIKGHSQLLVILFPFMLETNLLLQYRVVTMRSRRRRPQAPASGPSMTRGQYKDGSSATRVLMFYRHSVKVSVLMWLCF